MARKQETIPLSAEVSDDGKKATITVDSRLAVEILESAAKMYESQAGGALLEQPKLAQAFAHYGNQLRVISQHIQVVSLINERKAKNQESG